MARANAAAEDVRAVAWRDLAKSITQPLSDSKDARAVALEPWLRYLVPVFALLFLGLLAVAAVTHLRSERARAIEAAARAEVEEAVAFARDSPPLTERAAAELVYAETETAH